MAGDVTAAWVITNQAETSDLGPDGTYVPGVKVSFKTALGVVGSVFVPSAQYSADTVRNAVSARAAVADEVAQMAG